MGVRDRLIEGAIDLIRRNGVAGTGIAQLLQCSGVSRRSIYLNFPSGKSELVAEATRSAGRAYSALMRSVAASSDMATCLAAFPALWRDTVIDSDFTAGCPIVAAALGRADAPEAADAAGETFADWESILAERLRAERIAPELARSLATTIIAAVEGAVVMSLATRSPAPLERVAAQMSTLVAHHTAAA
ncbi:TetR/AcrR family transcriptional regulator [Nocardia sp. CA2R105]|uniref:TetR/AcrR family transcriptional regulator n=1 Tax=Nocardia coffeae TaxID=2873381 RepID=UPI001CA66A6C|nr:TetR/AcrR family transcriptional regulator [Nocardia coffeae]MBY8858356.1 TetR/AcrR family transcriptional regulator [Nocardia coffeae]